MSETEKLIARREAMQTEQHELRQQLAAWRARLATLADIRREALKRWDVGHDEARTEADTALDEIFAVEADIAKGERQLGEYPDRMHNLNLEIERTSYRDRCKELLTLQSAEREAWNEFAQLLPEFYEAWFVFEQARTERRHLARSLSNMAGTHGFTSPGSGDFAAPGVFELQRYLEMKHTTALEQIEAAVCKAAGR